MAKPKVGEPVEVFCTACGVNATATVAATVRDEVVSVECKTCGEQQRFRPPKSERPEPRQVRRSSRRVVDVVPRSKKGRRSSRSRDSTPTSLGGPPPNGGNGRGERKAVRRRRTLTPEQKAKRELRKLWDTQTENVDSRYARPHREEERYDEGEAILHKRFGMGIVEGRAADGTLTVLFRNGRNELESLGDEAAAE